MVDILGAGHKVITKNRRFDNYLSMKQYFKDRTIKEVCFAGNQLLTTTFATIDGGHGVISLTRPAAAYAAYLSTMTDDGNQDGKYVDVIWQDITGAIQPVVRTLLDAADPDVEVVIGNGVANLSDVVASVLGDVLTMTATDLDLNELAGWYCVGVSGNGDQLGVWNLIISNTASATVPEITLTDTPDANTATDVVQFMEGNYEDLYRIREMYCEVEAIEAKAIRLGDVDSTNVYANIGVGHRYMADSGIFTQPTATCDTYLGRIKGSTGIDTTVTEVKSSSIQVFYTPFQAYSGGGAVETVIEIPFQTSVCWEPCIKLAPATDVTIRVKYTAGAAIDNIFVEASYLEVYPVGSTPSS